MPWYIAFGQVIGWVLVAAVAMLPIGVVRLQRALRDRSEARDARVPFDVGQHAPAEGPVTLRGVLRGGHARTTTTKAGTEHARSEPLWVDHEGERIDLVGAVHVVRGTRARATWKARTYEVNDGDVVMVRGTASRTTSSYREQGWQLAPDGELEPVRLCADRPASRARVIPPGWLAAMFVVAAVGAYLALNQIGKRQLAKYPRKDWSGERYALSWTEPAAIAAMMPGTHDQALAHLYGVYAALVTLDQDNLDARVEIAERLEGRMMWLLYPGNTPPERRPTACEAAAAELSDQSRFEEAIARGCTGSSVDAGARLALGHYDELAASAALDDPERSHTRVLVELAHRRWDSVADALGPGCYADLARAFGGDREAMQRLQAGSTDDVKCRVAWALGLALDPTADTRSIALPQVEASHDHWQVLAEDLDWVLDPDPPADADEELVEQRLVAFGEGREPAHDVRTRELVMQSYLRRTWLSGTAPDHAPDVHAFRLFAAIQRGDLAAARAEAAASGRPALAKLVERLQGPATVDEARARQRRVELGHAYVPHPTQLVRFLHAIATHRDAAREVGDTAQVTRLQGIIDRHLARFTTFEQRLLLVLIAM